jgi:hypothetical protein
VTTPLSIHLLLRILREQDSKVSFGKREFLPLCLRKRRSQKQSSLFLAFLVRIIPKIGPLKVLQLRTPTPETERKFEASFNATLDRYRKLLVQVDTGQPDLPNNNFDTGAVTGPREYRLNDETHAKLLDALAKQNFSGASPELRAEFLEFYGHPDAPYATKRKPKAWAKVQAQLEQLKKAPPVVTGEAGEPYFSVHTSE